MLRFCALASLLLLVACGDGGTGGTDSGPAKVTDAGANTDAGTTPDGGTGDTDAGDTDAGVPPEDGGTEPEDGGHTTPTDAGVTVSLDLFEIKGKVPTGAGSTTQGVQILAPYVAVTRNDQAHAFDNRQAGLGCYADHYDTTHAPPTDVSTGTITITGYKGGFFFASLTSAPNKMTCQISSGNYVCSYGNFNASKPAATQIFGDTVNPLGGNNITFSNASSTLGTFSLTGSGTNTLTASGLDSLSFSASQDLTIPYACASNCSSSIVLITLAASRNAANAVPTASPSYGAVTCAANGSTSMTIPKEAIAAMLGGDTTLKSVVTTIVVATPPSSVATDSAGNTANVLVGRGVFGIASL